MSDAMSAVEIEDVLSSIRRLVSEDLRPAASRLPGPESRLILTAALRVVSEVPLDEDWAEDEDWTEEPSAPQLSPRGWSLPEAEPEPSELDEPRAVVLQPFSARRPHAEAFAQGGAPLPPHRFTLTQAARVVSDESKRDSPEERQPWDQPVDEIVPLSFEAETGLPRDAAEPDASEQHEVWADQAAAAAIADIESGSGFEDLLGVRSETDPAFMEDDEDAAQPDQQATFDEDLLRDLVRDILREELAGSLGEKITRNVRKLVRAEIAQALATRETG